MGKVAKASNGKKSSSEKSKRKTYRRLLKDGRANPSKSKNGNPAYLIKSHRHLKNKERRGGRPT